MSHKRKIRETALKEHIYDAPPASGSRVGAGGENSHHDIYEKQKLDGMTSVKVNRRKHGLVRAVIFYMVAELATWQAELAIKLMI
eukprot:4240407-Amphidinium_carterae.1